MPGKDLLTSSSFWGVVVTLLGLLAPLLNVAIDNPGEWVAALVALSGAGVQFVGAAVALYGIVTRKSVIRSVAGIRID